MIVCFVLIGIGWNSVEARPGNAPEMVEVLIGFEGIQGFLNIDLYNKKVGS